MRMCLPLSIVIVAAAGCFRISDGVICTLQFVYGVTVTVTDEQGAPVPGATLTLAAVGYTEAMLELGDLQPGVYVGAGERAGTYTLTVEAEGFEPATIEGVFVDADVCHVIPVDRAVSLTPG
jgi:hypothetical protein